MGTSVNVETPLQADLLLKGPQQPPGDSTVLPPSPCTRSTCHQRPRQVSPAVAARGQCLQVQLTLADSGRLEPVTCRDSPRRLHRGFSSWDSALQDSSQSPTHVHSTIYNVFDQHLMVTQSSAISIETCYLPIQIQIQIQPELHLFYVGGGLV